MKYSSNYKNHNYRKQSNTANKENSVPRKYSGHYKSSSKPIYEKNHNRYQTDTQIEKRALKVYNQFSDVTSSQNSYRGNNRKQDSDTKYSNKTPVPNENHYKRPHAKVTKKRVISQRGHTNRQPSPVLMCNASKPTKKMPSYKPQPKTCATEMRDYKPLATEVSPAVDHFGDKYDSKRDSKLIISKKNIKYKQVYENKSGGVQSRNQSSAYDHPKAQTYTNPITFTNPTYGQNSKPKVEKLFDYNTAHKNHPNSGTSEELKFNTKDAEIDQSMNTSVSSVFIPPNRGAKKNMGRLVKIKEKVLNPGSDHSHEVDFSSITNGSGNKENSITTLTMEDNDDEPMVNQQQDDSKVSSNYPKEVQYVPHKGMVKNYSSEVVYDPNGSVQQTSQKPQIVQKQENGPDTGRFGHNESLSKTIKHANNNMAITEHLKDVINHEKNSPVDIPRPPKHATNEETKAKNEYKSDNVYQNYIDTNTKPQQPQQPQQQNNNMINLENILMIEEKLKQLIQSINTMVDIDKLCEDWWEVTTDETMLMNLSSIFREPAYKQILKRAVLSESVAISLVYAIGLHLETPPNAILSLLKNLLLYTHQNFLLLIKLILGRLPKDTRENVWAYSLQALVQNKGYAQKTKIEVFNILGYGVEQQSQIILTLCKGRLTIQQLANERNITQEEIMQTDQFSINFYISPLAQTFLMLSEEIVLKPDLYTPESAREDLISSLEGFNSAIQLKREEGEMHDMYKIGGTAFGDGEELEVIDPPYLPLLSEAEQARTYTLVLDLDETLAHYFEVGSDGRFLTRPGVHKFLEEMNKYYEIVIFTAAIQDYADWAISQIDPNGYIKYRLYRQHAVP